MKAVLGVRASENHPRTRAFQPPNFEGPVTAEHLPRLRMMRHVERIHLRVTEGGALGPLGHRDNRHGNPIGRSEAIFEVTAIFFLRCYMRPPKPCQVGSAELQNRIVWVGWVLSAAPTPGNALLPSQLKKHPVLTRLKTPLADTYTFRPVLLEPSQLEGRMPWSPLSDPKTKHFGRCSDLPGHKKF